MRLAVGKSNRRGEGDGKTVGIKEVDNEDTAFAEHNGELEEKRLTEEGSQSEADASESQSLAQTRDVFTLIRTELEAIRYRRNGQVHPLPDALVRLLEDKLSHIVEQRILEDTGRLTCPRHRKGKSCGWCEVEHVRVERLAFGRGEYEKGVEDGMRQAQQVHAAIARKQQQGNEKA